MPETLDATGLLEYCKYDPSSMTNVQRRQQIRRLRVKYDITGIKGPKNALLFLVSEVKTKVKFERVPATKPLQHG